MSFRFPRCFLLGVYLFHEWIDLGVKTDRRFVQVAKFSEGPVQAVKEVR